MTEKARHWWAELSTTQKTLAALLAVAVAGFGMGAGVTAAFANIAGIPETVERHERQLARVDSLVPQVEHMGGRMERADSALAVHDRYITYLACRERRADRGLSLEYCEAYISPADFVSPLGR